MKRVPQFVRYALILAVIAVIAYCLTSCAEFLDLPQQKLPWI